MMKFWWLKWQKMIPAYETVEKKNRDIEMMFLTSCIS